MARSLTKCHDIRGWTKFKFTFREFLYSRGTIHADCLPGINHMVRSYHVHIVTTTSHLYLSEKRLPKYNKRTHAPDKK